MKYLYLVLLAVAPMVSQAHDACENAVPPALKAEVLKLFPGYRLPRETDNLAEDIRFAREHSESPCLGVTSADFDRDGKPDYLLGLTALNGPGALIVVALSRGSGWEFHKLDVWKDSRLRLYVAADAPGHYDDVGDSDGPLEKGQVEHLDCVHSVAVFGLTESSGVAYCFTKSGWKHVWISD